MDAPFEQLKKNYEDREKIKLEDEQFEAILQKEREMGLEDLKEYAKQHYTYTQNDNTRTFIERIKQNIMQEELER